MKAFRSLVLKVASRCNLNCSYCYMYNLGDTTYLQQPKFFAPELQDALLQRIKEHVVAHNLPQFAIIFHGGEPLLYPKESYREFHRKAQEVFADLPDFKLLYFMQSNGVLVDDEWCELFREMDVRVGFSMDGTKKSHDMYRVDHAGRGSYDQVVKGILTYKKHFHSVGIITVLNLAEDPETIYDELKAIGINGYNILFPDNNYDEPYRMVKSEALEGSETPVADWLIRLFEHWRKDPDEDKMKINLFETLFNLILGKDVAGNELYGETENSVMVVETNGDIESVDTLKSCGHGFTKGNLNVLRNTFEEALDAPLIDLYYNSHKYVSPKCQACPLLSVCGGGYITHRYSSQNGFNNPSIYCKDLMKLIIYLQNFMFSDLSPDALEKLGVHLLDQNIVDEIIQDGPEEPAPLAVRQILESFRRVAG